MKRLLLLLTVLLVVFVAINRQRVFLWDPVARVTVAGVAEPNARVMINFSNDVLLFEPAAVPGMQNITLLEGWNLTPGTPAELKCLANVACMTDADHATVTPLVLRARRPGEALGTVVMEDTRVRYLNADRALVDLKLR